MKTKQTIQLTAITLLITLGIILSVRSPNTSTAAAAYNPAPEHLVAAAKRRIPPPPKTTERAREAAVKIMQEREHEPQRERRPMTEHQDPCTNTNCKCFENGQQQEIAAVVAYIKHTDTLEYIDSKKSCHHVEWGQEPCAGCYRNELLKELIKGEHRA